MSLPVAFSFPPCIGPGRNGKHAQCIPERAPEVIQCQIWDTFGTLFRLCVSFRVALCRAKSLFILGGRL
jgi:hypothetical protein